MANDEFKLNDRKRAALAEAFGIKPQTVNEYRATYLDSSVAGYNAYLSFKPVDEFSNNEIKQIRVNTGLSQVMFAGSLGVSPKTVEAWENGRNKPEGASRRMLAIVRDNPDFVKSFLVEA